MRGHGKRLLGHDGSHVVDLAARDARIAAVICNVPALDALRGGNFAAKMRSARMSRAQLVGATARLLGAAAIDVYHGATFEQVVSDQIEFLRKHLLDDAA